MNNTSKSIDLPKVTRRERLEFNRVWDEMMDFYKERKRIENKHSSEYAVRLAASKVQ